MRVVLWACLVGLIIHLVPLFLPRNTPGQELKVARAMGTVRERVESLRKLKEHPKATVAELREAAELLLPEASGEAHALVKEAERREPESVETQLLLARVCELENRERCVGEALDRAGRLAPRDPRPDLLRADRQERVGNLIGAVESVGRAHRKAPGEPAVTVRYGRLLSEVRRFSEAEEVLGTLADRGAVATMLLELGLLRVRQGRDEEARELFQKVVEQEPKQALGHYYLGLTQFTLGDMVQAEESLREADQLDIGDWRPLTSLCSMQLRTGQREAARVTRMDLERRFPEKMDDISKACRME
jgi:Flp pilus assembly protein TadD